MIGEHTRRLPAPTHGSTVPLHLPHLVERPPARKLIVTLKKVPSGAFTNKGRKRHQTLV